MNTFAYMKQPELRLHCIFLPTYSLWEFQSTPVQLELQSNSKKLIHIIIPNPEHTIYRIRQLHFRIKFVLKQDVYRLIPINAPLAMFYLFEKQYDLLRENDVL